LSGSAIAPSGCRFPEDASSEQANALIARLFGEERPGNMLLLLFMLVLLLHLLLILWLLRPAEPELTPAQPLMMQVSMLSVAAPKPSAAPPAPRLPPPEKKPEPKKPPVKPLPKKVPPPRQKAPDLAPATPAAESPPVAPPVAAPAAPAAESKTESPPAETFTEAVFRANYLNNPKPEYPAVAKSRGWQGKVHLRVKVSAEGLSEAVQVETSSGHELLDDSAIDAVRQWRFVPAKRGETAVASSVIVPIVFTLRE